MHGSIGIMRLLIAANADVNKSCGKGTTPLRAHKSPGWTAKNWAEMVLLLLAKEATFGTDGALLELEGRCVVQLEMAKWTLQRLGLADIHGDTQIPLYVMNVTYPIVGDEFLEFADGKEAILVVEEGQPEFIEQALGSVLYKARSEVSLHGKDMLPMAGEYTGQVMLEGVEAFVRKAAPEMLPDRLRAPNREEKPAIPDLSKTVPVRPPGFCTGCPERPIFAALKLAEKDLGKHQVAGDIGLKSGGIGNTKGYSEYFRAFARQSVSGLWLTGFDINGDGAQMTLQVR